VKIKFPYSCGALKKVFGIIRKSRHFILAGINIFVSAANVGVLYYVFGRGIETTAYFIATSAIATINLLLLTFVEQFAFIYSSLHITSKDAANKFFWSAFWVVAVFGIFIWAIIYSNIGTVIKFYSPGLQGLNYAVAVSMTKILSISIITTTPLYLVQQKLGCLGRVSRSYLVSILPNSIFLLGLASAYCLNKDIYLALKYYAIGAVVTLLVFTLAFRRSLTGFDDGELKNLKILGWQSAKIRSAHNIHNIVSSYLISLSIGYTPVNLGSFFFGIKRGADVLTQIVIGPFIKSLPPVILKSIHTNDFQQILLDLKHKKAQISTFYVVTIIISVAIILFGQHKFSLLADDRSYYLLTCIMLFCYSWLNSVLIPYSMIASGYGLSKVFYISNTIFSAFLSIATLIVIRFQYYWLLPVGLAISQAVAYHFAMKYIRKLIIAKGSINI
jgi:hypothetical protein